MSSTSESEEETAKPVKRVKRRHQPSQATTMTKINLYSHKILPKLDALAKSPIKLLQTDEDTGNACVPFKISDPDLMSPTDHYLSDSSPSRSNRSPSPELYPITVIPPTPPPAYQPKTRRGRAKKKTDKILSEVTSVLSQVSRVDALNVSLLSSDDNVVVREIVIKIRFRGRLHKYPLDENNTFSEAFDNLATKEKVDVNQLLVTFNDKRVLPTDTPAGIRLSVADILGCVLVSRRLIPDKRNAVRIQMQGAFNKRKMMFTMGKTETFLSVMKEYAEEAHVSLGHLKFHFDGDLVHPSSSPRSLDMDDDDCIDVINIKKK